MFCERRRDTASNDSAPRPPTYKRRERGLTKRDTNAPGKATGCRGFRQSVRAECSLPLPSDFHMLLLFCGGGRNLFLLMFFAYLLFSKFCPSGRKKKRFKTYWRATAQIHLRYALGFLYTACKIYQDKTLLLSRWTLFYLKQRVNDSGPDSKYSTVQTSSVTRWKSVFKKPSFS